MLEYKNGFTLIELLVVISIIGVLSSVVMASLGGTRSKARDSIRISDMQQITNALELYSLDNNNLYPNMAKTCDNDSNWTILETILSSYISKLSKDPKGGNTGYHYCYFFINGKPGLSFYTENNMPNIGNFDSSYVLTSYGFFYYHIKYF